VCIEIIYRNQMHPEITSAHVAARLRTIRRAQSLSLSQVEALSGGRIKAVVLGSYERGSRNLTIKRAIEIARIYNLPVTELFTAKSNYLNGEIPRLMLDIRALQRENNVMSEVARNQRRVLSQMLRSICEYRQDWNGEVITLRESDLATISLLFNTDNGSVIDWLTEASILLRKHS
jgi:transcriptional regulator with XRE-family HTH domain